MSLFIIAISMSMILFLLASGLSLIFGIFGMVNFAHGVLYMFGAFIGYQAFLWTDSFWWALVLSPLVMGVVGAGIEFFLLRPVYRLHHFSQLMIQIGLIFVLVDFVKVIWGADYLMFAKPPLLSSPVQVLGHEVDPYRLFIIFLSILIGFAIFWALEKTDYGIAIRAASSNGPMATCLGIDVSLLRTLVFAFASALAAVAGVVTSAIYPIDALMGESILIDCFIVVVIGGLGNVQGAVLGAVLIGMTRAYGQYYLPEWVNVLTFSVFVLTLLLFPEGLFGRVRRRG